MNPSQVTPPVNSSTSDAAVAEAKAFLASVEQLARKGNELGNLALEEVARNLGNSCGNKHGRPSELAFIAFALAMSSRNLSIGARTQLANVANKAATAKGEGMKPVFKTSATASSMEGGFAYKLNLPVRLEAAIS